MWTIALERLRDLPDLLDAELPDLRLVAAQVEAVDRDAGEMALRPLGEDGDLRDEVGARLEVRQLLSFAATSLVAGADAGDAAVVDEKLLRRGLGEDHRPAFLRLLREIAAELGEREDPVAVVLHRRRRRDAECVALREHVDGLAVDLAVVRYVLHPEALAEEAAQAARVHDRAGEEMRARLLALLEQRDGNLAEALRRLRVGFEQLPEANRAREPRRARADDEDADLDPLVGRVGRRRDEVRGVERRREVARAAHPTLCAADQFRELRDDLVDVADDAEVAEVEDRRVRVLVDGDDRAGALHADLVLDRARDAERDVELRRDGLAGLADLRRVRVPAGVDDRARRADRAAERLRELLRKREVLRRAEAAAAGDDDVGVLDVHAARLRRVLSDELQRRSSARRTLGETSTTSGSPPPVSVASNEPARKSARRGVLVQPTST